MRIQQVNSRPDPSVRDLTFVKKNDRSTRKIKKSELEKEHARLQQNGTVWGGLICVMDENYVPADQDQVPERESYSELPGRPLDVDRKVKKKEKFSQKFLVWQTISSDGQVFEPFIMKGSMKSEVCLGECVRRRLVLKMSYSSQGLATIHYSNIVQNELKSRNVKFLPEEKNPPNLPQARPIENFWSI